MLVKIFLNLLTKYYLISFLILTTSPLRKMLAITKMQRNFMKEMARNTNLPGKCTNH